MTSLDGATRRSSPLMQSANGRPRRTAAAMAPGSSSSKRSGSPIRWDCSTAPSPRISGSTSTTLSTKSWASPRTGGRSTSTRCASWSNSSPADNSGSTSAILISWAARGCSQRNSARCSGASRASRNRSSISSPRTSREARRWCSRRSCWRKRRGCISRWAHHACAWPAAWLSTASPTDASSGKDRSRSCSCSPRRRMRAPRSGRRRSRIDD